MEFEIKFSAPKSAILDAIAAKTDGAMHIFEMETTYFDTPNGALSAKKLMLRRRLENGVSVITCKTPAKGYARGEWDVQADDPLAALPSLIAQGAPGELRHIAALVPVCGARFTRRAFKLALDGCTAELALDSGVLFRGETVLPLCEVELELKAGDSLPLLAFANELAARYGLTEEKRSKFARARAL